MFQYKYSVIFHYLPFYIIIILSPDKSYLKNMNNDQKDNYFMLLEDIKENIKRKVKFCKFIKVLEVIKN